MRYKCLILDHDDTAVNSTPQIHYPAHIEVMKRLRPGLKPVSLSGWIKKNFHPGIMDFFQKELKFSKQELEEEYRIWRRHTTKSRPSFFPGFVEALRAYQNGGGKISVVSHSEREIIAEQYKRVNFAPDFIYGWTYDDTQRKPSPWAVQQTMDQLGFGPKDLLSVDDLKPGVIMARNAGIAAAAAGWGHRIEEIEIYMRRHCDVYFDCVEDFRRYILT